MTETESLVFEIAGGQGWNDATIITLLCTYLDNQQSSDALQDFLQTIADEENAQNDICVECLAPVISLIEGDDGELRCAPCIASLKSCDCETPKTEESS